jgi:pimeloyl-ACP methyl ester carboxylesterase
MVVGTPKATEATVQLAAGPISYRSFGPEDGPAVVFVHGILVDGNLWRGVAERLGERGYRAITPDLPLGSHRHAMAPDADLSPRGVARMVLDLIAALGLDHVTLVGNDTGGAICQFVIDTDPGPVDRLVLTNCDSFRHFPPAAFKPMFWLGRVPGVGWAFLQPTRLRFFRHQLGFGPLVVSDPRPAVGRRVPGRPVGRDPRLPHLRRPRPTRSAGRRDRRVRPRALTPTSRRREFIERPPAPRFPRPRGGRSPGLCL